MERFESFPQSTMDEVITLLLELARAHTITEERAAEIREEADKLYVELIVTRSDRQLRDRQLHDNKTA